MSNRSDLGTDPYELIQDLEARDRLNHRGMLLFACACCRLVWTHLPNIAQDALLIGESFLQGQCTEKHLTDTRVKLWEFLGDQSCKFDQPRVNAVRAVICCLYPPSDWHETDDYYTAIECTMDFCNAVEPHEPEQVRLLRNIFERT